MNSEGHGRKRWWTYSENYAGIYLEILRETKRNLRISGLWTEQECTPLYCDVLSNMLLQSHQIYIFFRSNTLHVFPQRTIFSVPKQVVNGYLILYSIFAIPISKHRYVLKTSYRFRVPCKQGNGWRHPDIVIRTCAQAASHTPDTQYTH